MVTGRTKLHLTPESLTSPILDTLNEMAEKYLGVRLVIVFPGADGMDQVVVGKGHYLADFCKLIQGSKAGADHCRMAHLLMTESSSKGEVLIKRCHTGVSSLVKRVPSDAYPDLAILTSCAHVQEIPSANPSLIHERVKKLAVDHQSIDQALHNLPKLTPDRMEMAKYILTMAADALKLMLDKLQAEAELKRERRKQSPDSLITEAIETRVRQTAAALSDGRHQEEQHRKTPSASLIDIVTTVITERPHLPYRLPTVAAACGITPNHFSHLFHEQHHLCFSEFLTEQRLKMSKELLKDFTLNVSQVATGAGFRDAGYFARRFRQKNGISPREWRERLSRS